MLTKKRNVSLYLHLKDIARRLKFDLLSFPYKPHYAPTFVLGNQKSGTSIIAYLLAKLTGLSLTIDLQREIDWPTFHEVKSFHKFERFISQNRKDFSREIIKEPNLSLFYSYLKKLYPESKYLFVVREPKNNIRSILNRLRVSGNYEVLPSSTASNIPQAWKLVLDTRWLNELEDYIIPSGNYIELLAHRWNLIARNYLCHRDDMVLVRYEDFLADKVGVIESIAHKLELPTVQDISGKVDTQLQPKGDKNIDLIAFFGEKNFSKITQICAENMSALGYKA